MDANELLTTTRSVRSRLDLDRPLPLDLLRDCLRIAQQAPTARNLQGWHFVLVTDGGKRAALADIYRRAMTDHLAELPAFAPQDDAQTARTYARRISVRCCTSCRSISCRASRAGRRDWRTPTLRRSSAPSTPRCGASCWRCGRAGGSTWTSIHLRREAEAARLFGIPDGVTQIGG